MRHLVLSLLLFTQPLLAGCSGIRALPHHSVEDQMTYSLGRSIMISGISMSALGLVGGGWAAAEHEYKVAGLAAGSIGIGILGVLLGRWIMVHAAGPDSPAAPSIGPRSEQSDDDQWRRDAAELAKAVKTSTSS